MSEDSAAYDGPECTVTADDGRVFHCDQFPNGRQPVIGNTVS
jgi:hypothetical protein